MDFYSKVLPSLGPCKRAVLFIFRRGRCSAPPDYRMCDKFPSSWIWSVFSESGVLCRFLVLHLWSYLSWHCDGLILVSENPLSIKEKAVEADASKPTVVFWSNFLEYEHHLVAQFCDGSRFRTSQEFKWECHPFYESFLKLGLYFSVATTMVPTVQHLRRRSAFIVVRRGNGVSLHFTVQP